MAESPGQSGGCSRKLPQSELLALLQRAAVPETVPAGGELSGMRDLGDCCRVELKDSANVFLATADLLFPVSEDGHRFGAVAGVHAMSDIYAALGQPLFACATLGGDDNVLASDFASAALSGLAAALHEAGATLAGGHTVISDDTFLNVSVTGLASEAYDRQPPLPNDQILISKPLGSGLALTALRMGLVAETDITPEYDQMLRSNQLAAEALARELRNDPQSVRAVGDVSGFGLLGALRMIGDVCNLRISPDKLPATHNAEWFMREQSWSPLADANLRDSKAYTNYEKGSAVNTAAILLNDPQTSGGLVAIVDEQAAANLLAESSYGFTEIGVVQSVGQEFGVTVTSGLDRA